jgi:hypothetical protein
MLHLGLAYDRFLAELGYGKLNDFNANYLQRYYSSKGVIPAQVITCNLRERSILGGKYNATFSRKYRNREVEDIIEYRNVGGWGRREKGRLFEQASDYHRKPTTIIQVNYVAPHHGQQSRERSYRESLYDSGVI